MVAKKVACGSQTLMKENPISLAENIGNGAIAGTIILYRQTRDWIAVKFNPNIALVITVRNGVIH